MPEAPVYKYGLFPPWKNHVWNAREIATVQAIAIAHPMNQAPNEQFGLGVSVANATHALAPFDRAECIHY